MSFEHTVTVRFYEIDRAGIAFFGRFFEYCHAAFEEMQIAAFGDVDAHMAAADWGMPLVHTESDFLGPVRFGERLKVLLDVARLGERSITFRYRVLGPDGKDRARVRLVHAFIDMKTFQSRPVPEVFLDGLARLGLSPLEEGA